MTAKTKTKTPPNRSTPRAVRDDGRSQRDAVESRETPLDFNRDNRQPARIGDMESPERVKERFPASRVREAGIPAVGDRPPSADDLSPETLLGEQVSAADTDDRVRESADAVLGDIGTVNAGVGDGPDEAEDADLDPVGRAESRELERKAAQHAADPNFFEPAEAQMRREAGLDREARK